MRTAEQDDLLPIMHPLYNLREVCKQCILLEDHLFNPRKRCEDCIRKHFLTLEALFEEAVSLDNKSKWKDLTDGKAEAVRQLQVRWLDGEDEGEVAQEIRGLRKNLTPKCFDLRDMTSESRLAQQNGRLPLRDYLADIYLTRRFPHHVCR